MRIMILGIPCPKTERTFLHAQAAAGEWGLTDDVELVTDIAGMARFGVRHTPTVFVNEKEKSVGRIPSLFEFRTWIEEEITMVPAAVAQ